MTSYKIISQLLHVTFPLIFPFQTETYNFVPYMDAIIVKSKSTFVVNPIDYITLITPATKLFPSPDSNIWKSTLNLLLLYDKQKRMKRIKKDKPVLNRRFCVSSTVYYFILFWIHLHEHTTFKKKSLQYAKNIYSCRSYTGVLFAYSVNYQINSKLFIAFYLDDVIF